MAEAPTPVWLGAIGVVALGAAGIAMLRWPSRANAATQTFRPPTAEEWGESCSRRNNMRRRAQHT